MLRIPEVVTLSGGGPNEIGGGGGRDLDREFRAMEVGVGIVLRNVYRKKIREGNLKKRSPRPVFDRAEEAHRLDWTQGLTTRSILLTAVPIGVFLERRVERIEDTQEVGFVTRNVYRKSTTLSIKASEMDQPTRRRIETEISQVFDELGQTLADESDLLRIEQIRPGERTPRVVWTRPVASPQSSPASG